MLKKILICFGIILFFVLMYNLIDLSPSSKDDFKILGIDISHHNKIYDWNQINKRADFCIIKASEGKSYKDPMFNSNWNNSKKHNIVRGAYHFFAPGISAEKQFSNYKNQVKLVSKDLPPILDVELKECDIDEVNKWLKLAENYYGVKPIVYTDYLFFKVFMERKLGNYPLWLHLNYKLKVKPKFNNFDCVFWQYNQEGRMNGISGDIDLDSFLGDSKDFNNLLIK